ncbi:MAG TPA: HEAT repeat domain-containing protein [Oscillatoriaceae cyanobacterium M33_DOE_052]|nr:HEAT repeat domain-containing protein [Oscillatoriaceae cyanobacterium M33_DOE_052]
MEDKRIDELIQILETTTNEDTRWDAARSLGKIAQGDERAISALIRVLETSTNEDTRWRAADGLGRIAQGDERAISALVRILETTTDEYTRRQAASSLGQIAQGDEKAISELVRILETTKNQDTRQRAAASLGEIAPKGDERALSALIRVLETTTNESTRRQAASSLGKIDPGNEKPISELVRVLETSTDWNTRWLAAECLGKIAKGYEKTISGLVRILETSTDEDTYRQVAYSLGQIAQGDERAISALVRILETSTNEDTRREAAECLGEIAKGDERAISALVRILETSTHEYTRWRAADGLGRIAQGDERAISALVRILETSTDKDTRQRAAYSLGQIGQGDERAISELVRILETTTNEDTRWLTAECLGKIAQGDERAISELVRILETTTDKDTRRVAAECLGQIGQDNTTAIKALIKLLSTSSSILPLVETLEKITSPDNSIAIEGLREIIHNNNPDHTRQQAKKLLQKIDVFLQKIDVSRQAMHYLLDNCIRRSRSLHIKKPSYIYLSVNSYYYQSRKFWYQRILDCLDRMQQGRDIINRRSLMQSYLEIYQRIVAFFLQFNDYKNTFIYTELFRNRYLVERIAQQDAPLPQTISPALAQQVQTAKQTERQTLQAYTDAISNRGSETELELLSQAWENAKQTLENLYHQVAEIEPEFIAKTKVYPISYEEVQKLLPADTAIIEFFLTETELITLLILPGADSPRIPEPLRVALKPNHLEPLAREWVADLDDKNKSKTNVIDAPSQQLSQRIDRLGEMLNLTHLSEYLPPQINHLIIVPNNYLHLFPIHALPWNKSERLINRFSVRYFPNLHIWKICQQRQRSRDSFLGIPNPTQDQKLIFAEAEIASIAQKFAPEQRKVLDSSEATKSKIIADAKDRHCFHFSGHGEYNFTNPLESYLQLLKNHGENLTLSHIFTDLHLPQTDLVTLSACCTGVVDAFQPTDEYLGLPTGFLLAGAKAVVSSLWKVRSISTAFLLDEFYRQLAQNPDKAVALQNAQNWLRTCNADDLRQRVNEWDLSMLKWPERISLDTTMLSLEDIPFENPYFWAAFIVTGF